MEKHRTFLFEWLDIEPSLKDVDLRPAVYLARETLPLSLKSKSLSPAAKKAVTELLKVSTLSSRAAQETIKSIPNDETADVMHELVGLLKQNSDWNRRRIDVNGAILLARAKPEHYSLLASFIDQIPNKPAWLQALMKDESASGG